MKYALGIDIGGTNIKALAVTPSGEPLAEAAVATCDGGKKDWVENVRLAKSQIEQKIQNLPNWIGLAAPGLVAKDQCRIRSMPGRLPGLEGLLWRRFFKAAQPVPILNDAHAALLGEVWCGAARGAQNAILLTLGTGVGGAALVDGRLLRGHLGRAGHLGHISLNPSGHLDIVQTPGSLEDAIGDCTVKSRSEGRFSTTQALVAASKRNDPMARRVWLKSVQSLAAGIVSLINVLDPKTVILSGGISKAGPALFIPLKKYLAAFEWRPFGRRVAIVRAKLDDRAGTFGAAWNAMQFQE